MDDYSFAILSNQQDKIVLAREKKIVVSAGPGSGKTYTLVKRIVKELEENDYSIIVTSFTKEASRQLQEKLSAKCDMGNSYVGTLDSLVSSIIIGDFKNRYLVSKGYKSVDRLRFVFPTRNSEVEILTREGMSSKNLNRINACYEKWIDNLSCGIYEISSICYLVAINLLKTIPTAKKYISEKYKAIYIDEAQDLNDFQHRFINYLISDCGLAAIMIGDKNQSIYQFRGARPEYFYELRNKGFTEYKITVSVRCHQSILAFANLIVENNDGLESVIENNVALDVEPYIDNLINLDGNFMILFENNNDAYNCYQYCQRESVDAFYSKRIEISDKDFSDNYLDLIEELIRFKLNINNSNPKLVYSVDELKDLLSNYVIVDYKVESAVKAIELDIYDYIIRVLKAMKVVIPQKVENELFAQTQDQLYINHYFRRQNANRIMTIHSSKGLEADNVFVIISKKPYKFDDEFRRKMFVAFSRAKNRLYISYKETTINGSELDVELRDNLKKISESILNNREKASN